MSSNTEQLATQTLPVYRAAAFVVVSGVAEGDAVSFADELVLDDIYNLLPRMARSHLTVGMAPDASKIWVAERSDLGHAGNRIYLDCCLTLMNTHGTTHEALVLVEVQDGGVEAVYLLPLSPLVPESDYRLVGIDRDAAQVRFADLASVAFAAGTHITLASGEQMPIEQLSVGDRVLTRDDGPQIIRWIGRTTLRALGEFAPVLIRKGTLHNENDLILSPDHRLFVYQRQDRLGAGRAEVLVRARHLVNGTTVVRLDGGFIDYYQLLFDEHQLIYAEGIAAESLLIDPRIRQSLPREVRNRGHRRRHHHDYEVQDKLIATTDIADLLRKASST